MLLLGVACLREDNVSQEADVNDNYTLHIGAGKVTDGEGGQALPATLTVMKLAAREQFAEPVAMTADKPLSDKSPLRFSEITFGFVQQDTTYTCTLRDTHLQREIAFSMTKCTDVSTEAQVNKKNHQQSRMWLNVCKQALSIQSCEEKTFDKKNNLPHTIKVDCHHSGAGLFVGYYEGEEDTAATARDMMSHYALGTPRITASCCTDTVESGDFVAATKYMLGKNIRCEKDSNNKVALVFPSANTRSGDLSAYQQIALRDNIGTRAYVYVGLTKPDSGSLAIITIEKIRTEDSEPARSIYNAYFTDDKGAIKKHVKVDQYGAGEKVILDDYQLQ